MLRIEEITSEGRFKALEAEWNGLLERSGQYSPFLSHDWFRCCCANYGNGKDMFILVIRDGSELIGIAPFWRYQDHVRGFGIRRIGFINIPDTPFADFIIHKEKREVMLEALVHYFFITKGSSWDILTLSQWPERSENYKSLQEILRKRHRKCLENGSSTAPYIPIEGDWEVFLRALSQRFRKTHRNIINKIGKLNNVEIQCFRQDKNGSLMEEILAVSEKSWKQEKGIAISSREDVRAFFVSLTEAAGERGWLLVWLLRVDGIPIAMEYDLEYGGKVDALRSDFNEAYKEYSPGSYLEYHIVKYLFENGYREYSTGPGMNAYKLHWTDKYKENKALHLYNNNLKGWMIWSLEDRLIPCVRRIRDLKMRIGSNR